MWHFPLHPTCVVPTTQQQQQQGTTPGGWGHSNVWAGAWWWLCTKVASGGVTQPCPCNSQNPHPTAHLHHLPASTSPPGTLPMPCPPLAHGDQVHGCTHCHKGHQPMPCHTWWPHNPTTCPMNHQPSVATPPCPATTQHPHLTAPGQGWACGWHTQQCHTGQAP